MPEAWMSPFKPAHLAAQPSPRFAPPTNSLKHSSSPTKRPISRPIHTPSGQLSPTKLRSRSPQKAQKTSQPSHPYFKEKITPDIVWSYLKLGYNIVLALIGILVVYHVVRVFRNDVRIRVEQQSAGVVFEIEECARNYMRNKCMPGQRVPVLDDLCNQWEKCMNMNPEKVLHSKLFAEAMSDAFASFLGALSIRTMLFLVGVILGLPLLVNCMGPRRKYYY